MLRMNLILIYDKAGENILMCKRAKEPYKGKYNLVGGKLEPGETAEESAYRELFEETGITSEDVKLSHLIDFAYPCSESSIEVFTGKLKREVQTIEEVNKLEWFKADSCNFFDKEMFAGEGNIGHMVEQTLIHSDKLYNKEG